MDKYLFPPPVFVDMQGEFVDFDLAAGWLTTKFTILERYRNPYGSMQGGMIAAAVDNTLGPLSVVVAPINVTRTLEMKYSQPVMPEMKFILVKAQLVERDDLKLFFEATVRDRDGQRLARCKAVHWIIANQTV
jgi:acyl-coenzyme A thioesterase PaaI-like protein